MVGQRRMGAIGSPDPKKGLIRQNQEIMNELRQIADARKNLVRQNPEKMEQLKAIAKAEKRKGLVAKMLPLTKSLNCCPHLITQSKHQKYS